MKLRIAIVAVMLLFAAGLYLYINPVEKGQPKHFHTIVVLLGKHLPTTDS